MKWKLKKPKPRHILAFVLLLIVLALCVRYLVPLCRLMSTQEGREQIVAFVESFGVFGPLVFILLMALQIIIAFIPGGPLEMAAGMLFGGIGGTICSMAGAVLGSACVYALVKRFGRPFVEIFVDAHHIRRFAFLHDEEKLAFWVFILFLVPGIPKDLLTYLVPLTKMPARQFLVLSNLARFPAVMAAVLVGDSLSEGRYWLCIVIACVTAVATFGGYQLKAHLSKKEHDRV